MITEPASIEPTSIEPSVASSAGSLDLARAAQGGDQENPREPDNGPSDPVAVLLPALATGVSGTGWHAIERLYPPTGGPSLGMAVCGYTATVVSAFGAFDRDRWAERACPECAWRVAIRQDSVGAELAQLRDPHTSDHNEPGGIGRRGGYAARVAEAILTNTAAVAATSSGAVVEDDLTVQLLCTVTTHAPVRLVELHCAEAGCGHEPGACPTVGWACPACSVRTGGWAGEWEGRYELLIPGPCEVLRTLARRYRHPHTHHIAQHHSQEVPDERL